MEHRRLLLLLDLLPDPRSERGRTSEPDPPSSFHYGASTEPPADPEEGSIYYNRDDERTYVYAEGRWVELEYPEPPPPQPPEDPGRIRIADGGGVTFATLNTDYSDATLTVTGAVQFIPPGDDTVYRFLSGMVDEQIERNPVLNYCTVSRVDANYPGQWVSRQEFELPMGTGFGNLEELAYVLRGSLTATLRHVERTVVQELRQRCQGYPANEPFDSLLGMEGDGWAFIHSERGSDFHRRLSEMRPFEHGAGTHTFLSPHLTNVYEVPWTDRMPRVLLTNPMLTRNVHEPGRGFMEARWLVDWRNSNFLLYRFD